MKNNFARWILAALLLLTSIWVPAVEARTSSRAGDNEVTDAAKLVTEFDVNGLKVLFKRRAGSQTVVAGLFLRGGSRNVNDKNAGVEALMLDVATEASTNYPREKFRRENSSTGTVISYGINYDYSVLSLATTRRFFDRSWDLFVDSSLRPSFAPDDFQRVKNRLMASLSDDEDTPESFIQVLQSRVIYAGHPYLNDPRGTVESLSKVTLEDVRKFHQEMMQTSRLLLVVVGDIDPAALKGKVEASFGKLPRRVPGGQRRRGRRVHVLPAGLAERVRHPPPAGRRRRRPARDLAAGGRARPGPGPGVGRARPHGRRQLLGRPAEPRPREMRVAVSAGVVLAVLAAVRSLWSP